MAKEGLLGALGRFASGLADAAPEGPRNVWSAIGPWVADLTRSASQHWLPHLLTGIPCEVIHRPQPLGIGVQCPSPAIAGCAVCRKPVCLDHSFVARGAQAICFPCAKQAIDDHAPGGPRPASPRGHSPDPGAPPHSSEASSGTGHANGQAPPHPPTDPTLAARLTAARKILKVKRSATWTEVEASYKALLVKHHPDLNPQNRAQAEARFKEVRVAYDLLKQHAPRDGAPS